MTSSTYVSRMEEEEEEEKKKKEKKWRSTAGVPLRLAGVVTLPAKVSSHRRLGAALWLPLKSVAWP